jgi:hypothetical protein
LRLADRFGSRTTRDAAPSYDLLIHPPSSSLALEAVPPPRQPIPDRDTASPETISGTHTMKRTAGDDAQCSSDANSRRLQPPSRLERVVK